jgi:hypothetical protein
MIQHAAHFVRSNSVNCPKLKVMKNSRDWVMTMQSLGSYCHYYVIQLNMRQINGNRIFQLTSCFTFKYGDTRKCTILNFVVIIYFNSNKLSSLSRVPREQLRVVQVVRNYQYFVASKSSQQICTDLYPDSNESSTQIDSPRSSLLLLS